MEGEERHSPRRWRAAERTIKLSSSAPGQAGIWCSVASSSENRHAVEEEHGARGTNLVGKVAAVLLTADGDVRRAIGGGLL